MNNLISANIYNFYKNVNDACNGKYYENIYYKVVKNKEFLFPNTIFNLNLDLNNYRTIIDELEENIKKGIFPSKIVTELNSVPFEFIQYFIGKGADIEIQPGMLLKYSEINTIYNEDVEIIEINPKQNSEWSAIISESFFNSKFISENQIKFISDIPNIKLWGAIFKNKFVGACLTQIEAKVIGLHFVGVKKEYRKLGIGKILSQESIIKHKNENTKYAILRASKYGEKIYKEIGFREYTKFVIIS